MSLSCTSIPDTVVTHIIIVVHLSIDSVPQKHTVSLTGNTIYVGNFGLWQGSLSNGAHNINLDYRSPVKTTNTVSPNLEWQRKIFQNRALTTIVC